MHACGHAANRLLWALIFPYRPAIHDSEHDIASVWAPLSRPYFPGAQCRQAASSSVVAEKFPYFPAGQLKGHASASVNLPKKVGFEYFPPLQTLTQLSCSEVFPSNEGLEYFPPGQNPGQASSNVYRPIVLPNLPAGHW